MTDDVVRDELERLFGIPAPATRGRRRRAVAMIREAIFQSAGTDRFPRDDDAVRQEIRDRHARLDFATDIGLASHWDELVETDEPVDALPYEVNQRLMAILNRQQEMGTAWAIAEMEKVYIEEGLDPAGFADLKEEHG